MFSDKMDPMLDYPSYQLLTAPAMPTLPGGEMSMPILQNIVSTVNLGVPLELKNLAMRARNAEYNPKRFAAVIMRIREPRTTALIFSSGKMVCTGAKSEDASRLVSRIRGDLRQTTSSGWLLENTPELYKNLVSLPNSWNSK